MSSPLLISANKDFIVFSSKVLLYDDAVDIVVALFGGGGGGGGGGGDPKVTCPVPKKNDKSRKT
jgi:hypothetical protein